MILTDIIKCLKGGSNIGIITHVQPDGDALGSSLALGLALEELGKDVVILRNDKLPAKYSFLPGLHLMESCSGTIEAVDILVALDCADLERLGCGKSYYHGAKLVLNIDHHISNTMFGNLNLVDTNAAATGELIHRIIKLMGLDLNLDTAECIFTAIAADTGCFKYDNTTSVTHGIAGELIAIGVDANRICNRIFNLRTLAQTKILGKAIEGIQIHHGGRTAIMVVTESMMEEAGCTTEDLEGIIEFARDIEGIEVAAFLRDAEDDDIKVSLRSNEYIDTVSIAKAFGGGGHKKASGYTTKGPIEDAINKLVKKIGKCYG